MFTTSCHHLLLGQHECGDLGILLKSTKHCVKYNHTRTLYKCYHNKNFNTINYVYSPHCDTLQYSHLLLGSVVKHHGPSGPLDPGLRQ